MKIEPVVYRLRNNHFLIIRNRDYLCDNEYRYIYLNKCGNRVIDENDVNIDSNEHMSQEEIVVNVYAIFKAYMECSDGPFTSDYMLEIIGKEDSNDFEKFLGKDPK